jgi:poly(A) polymerase
MKTFNLPPCQTVGDIKSAIKEAILEGEIHNDYEEARAFMLKKGKEMGLGS